MRSGEGEHGVGGPRRGGERMAFSGTGVLVYHSRFFVARCIMQDLNPILNKIGDLKGRASSLRGYL